MGVQQGNGGHRRHAADTMLVLFLIRTNSMDLADVGSVPQGSDPAPLLAEADAKARVDEGRDNNGAAAECLQLSVESMGKDGVEVSLSPEANCHLQEALSANSCEASGNE